MALEEDIPEQPEDKTIPKYKQIHKVSITPCDEDCRNSLRTLDYSELAPTWSTGA